jgi:hypothetical protein
MNLLASRAQFRWMDGKRIDAPRSGQYSTASRARGDDDWLDGPTWSLVVEFPKDAKASRDGTFSVQVRFLVADAPSEELRSGAVFELMEGPRVAAEVTII